MDVLIIGGAMANTFLAAQGVAVGRSLQEPEMHATAREILARATAANCQIILPIDAVTATEFRADPPIRTVPIADVPADSMILDVGPQTVARLREIVPTLRTLGVERPAWRF